MKKIVTLIPLLILALSFSACSNTNKEITAQTLYDSGDIPSLLEKYDSVYVQRTENEEVYQEEYYSQEYRYKFDSYDEENVSAVLVTDHAYYMYFENMIQQIVILTPGRYGGYGKQLC